MVRLVFPSVRIGRRLTSGVLVAVLCALAGASSGCGESGGPPCSVSGTITFEGKPLESGAIRFSTEDGTAGPGGLQPIANGHYDVKLDGGMRAGRYLVVILSFRKTGRMVKADESAPELPEEIQIIPARYNNASELHVELKGGENTQNFDLKK